MKPLWSWKPVVELKWRGRKFRTIRGYLNANAEHAKTVDAIRHPENAKIHNEKSSALKYGKLFLTAFQSSQIPGRKRTRYLIDVGRSGRHSGVCIGLYVERTGKEEGKERPVKIAEAGLIFDDEHTITMVFLGERNQESLLTRFNTLEKTKWGNRLCEEVETHAKKCGFKKLRIRGVENLGKPININPQIVKIRMRNLTEGIAKTNGFQAEGNDFVKYIR